MPEADLNAIDTFQSSTNASFPNEELDVDEMLELEEPIEAQYKEFESLGADLSKEIPQEYLRHIFARLIDYTNENYLSIIDYDTVVVSPSKTVEIGKLVYSFICVDNYFNILPNYLKRIECFTIDQFDKYFRNKLDNSPANFKASYISTIKQVVERLRNLQKLKANVNTDRNYINLMNKYTYYIELVNFGDSERFVYNYIRPILIKHFDDILWRTF
ncbi:MAG: hypothetical protein R3250_08355 [Melioribacteraceae bacterium]|nr:hypothetical protein [Melioribacteraceae bacterium]